MTQVRSSLLPYGARHSCPRSCVRWSDGAEQAPEVSSAGVLKPYWAPYPSMHVQSVGLGLLGGEVAPAGQARQVVDAGADW